MVVSTEVYKAAQEFYPLDEAVKGIMRYTGPNSESYLAFVKGAEWMWNFENSEKKSADANVCIDVAAGGYPRVMIVWDGNEESAHKQEVLGVFQGRYVVDSKLNNNWTVWENAKEVEPEPKIMELTIDEIAERFGVSADQIVIKK